LRRKPPYRICLSIISRSDWHRAKYKGVYFGEEPANGRLDELRSMVITDIGLYSDTISEPQITISEMEFVDNGRNLEFSPPKNCIQEGGHVDEKQ